MPAPTDHDRTSGDFELAFACLFCGREAAGDADDFVELNVSARGAFATFTCHAGCLRDAAHEPEHLPDLVRRAEPPPDYEPPSEGFVRAWDELAEVLGQIQTAELADEATIRSLTDAVASPAIAHGIGIEPLPPDEDDADRTSWR